MMNIYILFSYVTSRLSTKYCKLFIPRRVKMKAFLFHCAFYN